MNMADLAAMTPPTQVKTFQPWGSDRLGHSAAKSENYRQKAIGINPKCTIVKNVANHSPRRELRLASYAKKELATWR